MPIDSAIIMCIYKNNSTLTELNLINHSLVYNELQELANALKNNSFLTTLFLGSNQMQDKEAILFAQNNNLLYLDFGENLLTDITAKAFAQNTTLHTLCLSGNKNISNEGIEILAKNKKLKVLDVGDSQLGDKAAKALAENKTLIELFFSGGRVTDEGAKYLAKNNTLTVLHLNENLITDNGAEALAQNKTILSLGLAGNQIGNRGAKAFAKNMTLTFLNLCSNQIDDECAKVLINNINLTTLYIDGDLLSIECKHQLEKMKERNEQTAIERKQQFIEVMIVLARDAININSESLWSHFPKEIMLNIFELMDYHSSDSLHKSAQQVYDCAKFILDNINAISVLIKSKQPIKIMETSSWGQNRFCFFQPDSSSSLIEKPSLVPQISNEIEKVEPSNKIFKIDS